MRTRELFAGIVLAVVCGAGAHAQAPARLRSDTIASVVLYPVLRQQFTCFEHPAGQLRNLGDALGADCLVVDDGTGSSHRFPAFYCGDGSRNTDWYGWNQPVLAPFDGVVDSVYVNPRTNSPGTLRRARASVIVFRRPDSVRVLYAHVQAIRVRAGQSIRAGEVVARVGNNGPAYMPHTHVGAWKGKEPLQIRFDLRAMRRLSRVPDDSAGAVCPTQMTKPATAPVDSAVAVRP